MTEPKNLDLTAEVTAFVECLSADVLQELCDELQAVQADLVPRDQVLLEVALKRLDAIGHETQAPAPTPVNPKALSRPENC